MVKGLRRLWGKGGEILAFWGWLGIVAPHIGNSIYHHNNNEDTSGKSLLWVGEGKRVKAKTSLGSQVVLLSSGVHTENLVPMAAGSPWSCSDLQYAALGKGWTFVQGMLLVAHFPGPFS